KNSNRIVRYFRWSKKITSNKYACNTQYKQNKKTYSPLKSKGKKLQFHLLFSFIGFVQPLSLKIAINKQYSPRLLLFVGMHLGKIINENVTVLFKNVKLNADMVTC